MALRDRCGRGCAVTGRTSPVNLALGEAGEGARRGRRPETPVAVFFVIDLAGQHKGSLVSGERLGRELQVHTQVPEARVIGREVQAGARRGEGLGGAGPGPLCAGQGEVIVDEGTAELRELRRSRGGSPVVPDRVLDPRDGLPGSAHRQLRLAEMVHDEPQGVGPIGLVGMGGRQGGLDRQGLPE